MFRRVFCTNYAAIRSKLHIWKLIGCFDLSIGMIGFIRNFYMITAVAHYNVEILLNKRKNYL